MTLITEELKAKADEVYYGDKIAQEKTRLLLKEVGLPNGLLPLKDIIECGYVKETGFVWMKQKKAITHKFQKVGKHVSYAKEVTANVEKNRVKNLTGVKAKEVLIWLTLSEIYVDDPPTGNITFQIPAGLSRAYPVDAFEAEELEATTTEKKEEKEEVMEIEKEMEEAKEIEKEMEEAKEMKEVKEIEKEMKEVKEIKKEVSNAGSVAVNVKEV